MRQAVFGLVVALCGCMNNNIQTYGRIDPAAKTVTVPEGGLGLVGALKQTLSEQGWEMVVDRGPDVAERSPDATQVGTYNTFLTRYRLSVDAEQTDRCMPRMQPLYIYSISMVDTQKGAEVFTIAGRGCHGAVLNAFRQALAGKR